MTPNFFLPLKNVMLFQELVEQVCSRSSHLPGMACFYGPSGYGKTKSATYGANHSSAFYVELNDTSTRKSMCQMILTEVGLPGRGPREGAGLGRVGLGLGHEASMGGLV